MEIKTAARSRKPRLLTSKPLFPIALAMLIALSVAGPPVTPPASAIQADIGPLKGTLDTTVSAGIAIRVEERDPALVAQTNGGQAASANSDDGNLNFDQGDIHSLNIKVLHEGQWSWKNYGFFGRFYYFYDWAIMNFNPNFRPFTEAAQRRVGLNIKLLDAYLVGDWDIWGRPLTIRLGNQVLSWGESTFIQGGINSINPVDVSRLRVAGAELKEALLPIPMISFSTDLMGSLSLEGFYQFYWERTEIEPVGTYFSTNDFAGPGAERVMLGFGLAPPYGPSDNPVQDVGTRPPFGSWIPRLPDRTPSNMCQGGLALRYFAGWLRGGSEFGLYWEHIHSRRPVLAGFTGDPPPEEPLDLILWGLVNGDYGSTGGYFREYPGDIDIVGASMNTQMPYGIALQGEVSGRLGQPISMDDAEFLFRAYSSLDETIVGLRGLPEGTVIFGNSQQAQMFGVPGFNEEISGWQRKDMLQAQATFTKLFGPTLGTDQIVLLCEFGVTYFFGMEDKDELRYEGPGTFTSGNSFFSDAGVQPYTTTSGFADPLSWGYRLVSRLDFFNAIGPVTIMPVFAWFHDVEGTTPSPISNFVEGRKTMTLALRFEYLSFLRGAISYTMYMGAGQHNQLHDRDFLSISTSIAF
jgi:hypothetical protein